MSPEAGSADRARLPERLLLDAGVPLETVERSVRNSLCFGFYRGAEQAGFARVTTDYTTVADVFVPEHRGRGLGPWLMEIPSSHPELKGLRRWMLATADAYGPDCR